MHNIYVGTRSIPLFRAVSARTLPLLHLLFYNMFIMFMITLGIGFRDLPVYLEGALNP
jgi:hypothetical protein